MRALRTSGSQTTRVAPAASSRSTRCRAELARRAGAEELGVADEQVQAAVAGRARRSARRAGRRRRGRSRRRRTGTPSAYAIHGVEVAAQLRARYARDRVGGPRAPTTARRAAACIQRWTSVQRATSRSAATSVDRAPQRVRDRHVDRLRRRCRRRARPCRAGGCAGWPCTASARRRAGGRAACAGSGRRAARSRSSTSRRSPSSTRSSMQPPAPSASTTPSALLTNG